MKIIVSISEIMQIQALKGKVDGLVVACKYTQRTNHYFTLDKLLEIKELTKKSNLELFVLCDIFIITQELSEIMEFITTLIDDKVFFVFNDYAFLVALQKLNRCRNGIYSTSMLITNYIDFNYNKKWKIYGAFPAIEIPIDDLKIIGNNKSVKLFYYGFGKFIMFSSRRKLISNFFEYKNEEFDRSREYSLKEETRNELFRISENENGTYLYHSGIRNVLPVLDDLVLFTDYLFLDGTQIAFTSFLQVIDIYAEALFDLEHLSLYNQRLKAIVDDLSYRFIHEKTVYRKEDLDDQEN